MIEAIILFGIIVMLVIVFRHYNIGMIEFGKKGDE